MSSKREVIRGAVLQVFWQLRYGEDADGRGRIADAIADNILERRDVGLEGAVRLAIAAAFSSANDGEHGAKRQASMAGRYDGAF